MDDYQISLYRFPLASLRSTVKIEFRENFRYLYRDSSTPEEILLTKFFFLSSRVRFFHLFRPFPIFFRDLMKIFIAIFADVIEIVRSNKNLPEIFLEILHISRLRQSVLISNCALSDSLIIRTRRMRVRYADSLIDAGDSPQNA